MNWLHRNAGAIEACAAAVTAVAALAALVGVLWQLDSAEDLAAKQSAREIYGAHLGLAVSNPSLARPDDICDLRSGPNGPAYEAFVDHLLYAYEQTRALDPAWEPVMLPLLADHAGYVCQTTSGYGLCAETCPSA